MASDDLRHQVFLKEEQQQQLEIAREIALIREITEQLRDAISRSDVTALESAIAGALQVPSACRSRRRDASAHHDAVSPFPTGATARRSRRRGAAAPFITPGE